MSSFALLLGGSMAACGFSSVRLPVTSPQPIAAVAAAAGEPSTPPGPVAIAIASGRAVRGPIGDCSNGRGDSATFTLAHLNDLQARYSERIEGKSRYARIAGLLHAIKREVPATLVLDAGDDYEKGSLADLRSVGVATRRVLHALPIDVRTLGNHDFAYGEAAVRADVRASPHPVLSANVRDPEDGDLFKPFVSVDVGCVKVGVLGLVTQPYGSDDEQQIGGNYGAFGVDPRVVRVANEIVRQHRSKVDVMIALSHLGKGADTYLARQVPGLDFVIGGHSEDVIQKPIRVPRPDGSSALVMQAGRYGELVGRADVSVDLKRGRVSVAQYRLLPIDQSAPADENVERVVGEVEAEFTPNLHVVVGQVSRERTPRELVTLLAQISENDLEADAVLVGKDAFWGKLPAGPITLQGLYDVVAAQKQPVGTPGFTSIFVADVSSSELGRLKKVWSGARFVVESSGVLKPKATYRIALEKRLLENPHLVMMPAARFGEGRFVGELIDLLERHARRQTSAGLPIDSGLPDSRPPR